MSSFFFRKRWLRKLIAVGLLTTGVFVVFVFSWQVKRSPTDILFTRPVESINLGVETGPLASTVWVAEHNGYFTAAGLSVEIQEFSSGRDALASLLHNGKLDMATVAQTPVVLNSFNRNDYVIVAGMVHSPNDLKILARTDRNIRTPMDLQGKRVGVTYGSTGHYFLGLFLAQHGLSLHDVRVVGFDAAALPRALADGKIEAIATWEPHVYKARQLLGETVLLLESNGTFREDFYFAVLKEWAASHPETLRRYLWAIDQAELFIEAHPAEAKRIVAKRLNLDPDFIASIWGDYSFGLFLDQAILLTFEQQARWLQANGIVSSSSTPNYLDFIYVDALEDVQASAVTIIR